MSGRITFFFLQSQIKEGISIQRDSKLSLGGLYAFVVQRLKAVVFCKVNQQHVQWLLSKVVCFERSANDMPSVILFRDIDGDLATFEPSLLVRLLVFTERLEELEGYLVWVHLGGVILQGDRTFPGGDPFQGRKHVISGLVRIALSSLN